VSRLRIAVFVALATLLGSVAQAQQASIIGTAIDETKAIVPGVSVTATDQGSGRQIVAVTNERGEYALLNVPAGVYTVQAELSGFSTVVVKDVELLVGQNATIPFTLKLASVTETRSDRTLRPTWTPHKKMATARLVANMNRNTSCLPES